MRRVPSKAVFTNHRSYSYPCFIHLARKCPVSIYYVLCLENKKMNKTHSPPSRICQIEVFRNKWNRKLWRRVYQGATLVREDFSEEVIFEFCEQEKKKMENELREEGNIFRSF